jgi:hypothetical protein
MRVLPLHPHMHGIQIQKEKEKENLTPICDIYFYHYDHYMQHKQSKEKITCRKTHTFSISSSSQPLVIAVGL